MAKGRRFELTKARDGKIFGEEIMKKILIPVLFILSLFSLTAVSFAKTSDEYLEEVYQLIDKKQVDEALTLVEQGAQEYPGDFGLTVAYAEIQHLKGNYEIAIANYINILKALTSEGQEIPAMAHYHQNLVDAYNELGQRHYFPKELCLRIIYHIEKAFELMPEISQDAQYVEFLRKSVGHYDAANIGANVRMMEEGGDGAEFSLPDDYVSADEKLRYKDKAVQRIKEYDAVAKEKSFQRTASDKTVEDIIRLVKERTAAIKTIHFKKLNQVDQAPLEEFIYKSPNKIKVITPQAISIVVDRDYWVLDPQTKNILQQEQLDSTRMSLLQGMGFYNLEGSSQAYNLTVEKIVGCPDFLKDVCRSDPRNLYLITGKLISEDKGPFPPTPKIEYFIDEQSGLCVGKREYWLGIIGSGKEEELAREDLITRIEQSAPGVFFPSSGKTRGFVSELANLNQEWEGQVLSINQDISEEEFIVTNPGSGKK